MVIANALLSNANAISQGVSNANDAIGVLQIADGVLISLNSPNISSIDISSQDSIAAFRDSVNAMRADIGSTQQGLLSNINASITAANSAKASESQLQNNDVVKNLSDLNNANLQLNSTTLAAAHNMSLLAQQVSSLLR